METLMDKRKVLFLFLPLLVLFVYDRIGDVVIFIIHKAFDVFAVSESFIDTSASFIDATTAVVLSVICYLFYRKVFPRKQAEVSLPLWQNILFAIVIGFGVGGLATIWLNFAEFVGNNIPFLGKESEAFSTLYDDLDQGPFIWTFLAIVVVGPLVEEILFRGIIFSSFEEVTDILWFPAVLSGVMFGVWHGSFIQAVYTAMTGIALGYFMKKSRSLFFTVLAHGVNNLSGTLPPFLDTALVNGFINIMSYLCIIPMFCIFAYLHFRGKKEAELDNPELYTEEEPAPAE